MTVHKLYNSIAPRFFDVVGIGSPLLDIFINVTKNDTDSRNVQTLLSNRFINQKDIKKLSCLINNSSHYSAAGSVVNSLLGLDALGFNTALIGQLGNDANGKLFLQKISLSNVNVEGVVFSQSLSSNTGLCFVSVDENDEKFMSSYLGDSLNLQLSIALAEIIKKGKIVYLEGYLWNSKEGINFCKSVGKFCKEHDIKLAFNLSDIHIVEKERHPLKSFVTEYVEIIFGNLEEYRSFFESKDFNMAKEKISETVSIICITKDKCGSAIFSKGELIEIPAYPTECINSTGAGDLYVSGFLAALLKGFDLYHSAEFASFIASKFISVPLNNKNQAIKDLAKIFGELDKYSDKEKKCRMNTFRA